MSETLTDERLAEIEARANAATPGPWTAETDPLGMVGVRPVYESHVPGCTMPPEDLAADVSDAEFIAHAREDVPTLVAEVRRLRAKLPEGA